VAGQGTALAITLVVLTIPALLINLYFALLLLNRGPGIRDSLGALFRTCGADTSSCAIVVRTPYARLFGGAPNVHVGLLWNLMLLALAFSWMGRATVPWPYLLVAAASVLVGLYLVRALVVDLRQPCPL
jgi:uncharacterized membrane protein